MHTELADRRSSRKVVAVLFAAVTAAILFVASALPAWAAGDPMTLTFVRHAQSEGNVSGRADTSIPGPVLTPLGLEQAQTIAEVLAPNDYDGIFVSPMIRTRQTATPLAELLDEPMEELYGLREVEAGIFDGMPSIISGLGTGVAKLQWLAGNRYARILGAIDGNEFETRMNDAIQTIYDTGSPNAVAFSHQGTITFWVAMNVKNPAPLLMLTHPLDNTNYVVIEGSPEDGWTLKEWNGVEVSAEPAFPTKLLLDTRGLIMPTSTNIHDVLDALATLDPATIATAVADAAVNQADATVAFVQAVARDVLGAASGDQSALPNLAAAVRPSSSARSAATADEQPRAVDIDVADDDVAVEPDLDSFAVPPGDATDLADGDEPDSAVPSPAAHADRAPRLLQRLGDRVSDSLQAVGDVVGDIADANRTGRTYGSDGADADAA